jgi:hypothetical protein
MLNEVSEMALVHMNEYLYAMTNDIKNLTREC